MPASSAARCGDTAGPKRYGETASAVCGEPAERRSSSWSGERRLQLGQPGDRRLEGRHALAACRERRRDRAGHDGLADLGVGPGDEDAAH